MCPDWESNQQPFGSQASAQYWAITARAHRGIFQYATLEFQPLKFTLQVHHKSSQGNKRIQNTAHSLLAMWNRCVYYNTKVSSLCLLNSWECQMELLPVLWEENNGPKEGHLELLRRALLLKGRIEVVRVGEGVRIGWDHPHWEDFIANFPLPGSWKINKISVPKHWKEDWLLTYTDSRNSNSVYLVWCP